MIACFHEPEVPRQSAGAGPAVVLPNVIQLLDKSVVESCRYAKQVDSSC